MKPRKASSSKHADPPNLLSYSSSSRISGVTINRYAKEGEYKFTDIFNGFEKIPTVKKIFATSKGNADEDEAKNAKDLLSKQKVEVFAGEGYMGVSDEDGRIYVSQQYLQTGDLKSIYLDVVHELAHVKQFTQGRDLFDRRYSYVDRPTEIEAYKVTVEEARRIGMTEEAIFDYLKVDWISEKDHIRLAEAISVRPPQKRDKKEKG
jgi:hypothetical protein